MSEEGRLGGLLMFLFGLFANNGPIFLSHVIVYRRGTRPVQAVSTVFLGARNPIVLIAVYVKVVGLEATTFEAPKCLSSVVKALARLGETDTTDAGWTSDTRLAGRLRGLILDVHDSRLRHGWYFSFDSTNLFLRPGKSSFRKLAFPESHLPKIPFHRTYTTRFSERRERRRTETKSPNRNLGDERASPSCAYRPYECQGSISG